MDNCYFFVDETVSLEKRKISILCVECHDTKMPDKGMFYDGKNGYGQFDYKCCSCGNIIHKGKNEHTDTFESLG